jgi:hypothetical protein
MLTAWLGEQGILRSDAMTHDELRALIELELPQMH